MQPNMLCILFTNGTYLNYSIAVHANEHSFDSLAREIAHGSISRGRVLKLIGGSFLGGMIAAAGFGGMAEAASSRKKCPPCTRKKCKRKNGKRKCKCTPLVIPPLNCTNPFDVPTCAFTTSCQGCQEGQTCTTSGCASGSGGFCYHLAGFPSNLQGGLCGSAPSCSQLTDCTTQCDCPAGQFCAVTCCPTATAATGATKCIPSCSSAAVMEATEGGNETRSAPTS